jgi:porin
LRTWSLLLLLASSLFAAGQSLSMNVASAPQSSEPSQVKQETDELRQQLDIDAAALSKIPADPLIRPDPRRRSGSIVSDRQVAIVRPI